jgi:hypothetical protein
VGKLHELGIKNSIGLRERVFVIGTEALRAPTKIVTHDIHRVALCKSKRGTSWIQVRSVATKSYLGTSAIASFTKGHLNSLRRVQGNVLHYSPKYLLFPNSLRQKLSPVTSANEVK